MTLINRGRERERLAATYAEMSGLELTDLARDQRSLTEDALNALEAEFSKRGIPFERENLETAEQQNVKLVALRRFTGLPQALVAKGVLDSAGVKCFLSFDNTVRMDWVWSSALGQIRLWVVEDDIPEAATLLSPEYSNDSASEETEK
jgi:hypothetical protein